MNLIQKRLQSLMSIKKVGKLQSPILELVNVDGRITIQQCGVLNESVDDSTVYDRIQFYNYMLRLKIKLYLNELITIKLNNVEFDVMGCELDELISTESIGFDYWYLKSLQVQFKFESGSVTFYEIY